LPTNKIVSEELSPLDISMLSNNSFSLSSSINVSAEKCIPIVAKNINCEEVSPFDETLQLSLDMSLENSSGNVSFLYLYKLIVLPIEEYDFYIFINYCINFFTSILVKPVKPS